MLEIELKYRVDSLVAVAAKLESLGAGFDDICNECDFYFNAPDRDFKTTDEVFRLRCEVGSCVLTYKGPKRPGTVKSREEIEVPLVYDRQEDATRLIMALGYRLTAKVEKQRTIYALERDGFDLHICLDSLEGIGEFVEVEIVAEKSDLARAEQTVKAVAAELGLSNPEPRAYLRMVLESLGSDA